MFVLVKVVKIFLGNTNFIKLYDAFAEIYAFWVLMGQSICKLV